MLLCRFADLELFRIWRSHLPPALPYLNAKFGRLTPQTTSCCSKYLDS
jgi:hypothetical protein